MTNEKEKRQNILEFLKDIRGISNVDEGLEELCERYYNNTNITGLSVKECCIKVAVSILLDIRKDIYFNNIERKSERSRKLNALADLLTELSEPLPDLI